MLFLFAMCYMVSSTFVFYYYYYYIKITLQIGKVANYATVIPFLY